MMSEYRTFNLDEAAAFLRMHPQTLRAKARAGKIPGRKTGHGYLFHEKNLTEWLQDPYVQKRKKEDPAWLCLGEVKFTTLTSPARTVSELKDQLRQQIAKRRSNTTIL